MSNYSEELDDGAELTKVLEGVSSVPLLIKMVALIDAFGENDDEQFKDAFKGYLDAVSNVTLGVSARPVPLPL